jgi:hypothetical protein
MRLTRAFLSVAGAGDLLRESVDMANIAWAENTALSEEATKRWETMERQLVLVKNKINDLMISIGAELQPIITEFLDFVMPYFNRLSEFIVANLPIWIQHFRDWIDYLWLEFGPIFMEIWEVVKEQFNRVYEVIKPHLDTMIDTFNKMLMQIIKTDAEGVAPFIVVLGNLAVMILPMVIDAITMLITWVGQLILIWIEARNMLFELSAKFDEFSGTVNKVYEGISGPLIGAFNSFIGKVKEAWQWVNDLINSLFSLGGASSFIGSARSSAGFAASRSALGNVFNNGHIQAYAQGGIVSSPTLFPMANGMGLMGEAGPEAILPLGRDSSGRLGVRGGGGVTVQITGNNFYGDDKEFAERVGNTIIKELKSNLAIQGF